MRAGEERSWEDLECSGSLWKLYTCSLTSETVAPPTLMTKVQQLEIEAGEEVMAGVGVGNGSNQGAGMKDVWGHPSLYVCDGAEI